MIAGALLLDGIRSMFGHHSGLSGPDNALGNIGDKASPLGGSAADSDLARDAGIDHIGHGSVDAGRDQAAKDDTDLADTPDDENIADDTDFDDVDNGDYGDDGGSDYA